TEETRDANHIGGFRTRRPHGLAQGGQRLRSQGRHRIERVLRSGRLRGNKSQPVRVDLLPSGGNGLQYHLCAFQRQPAGSDQAQGRKRLAAVRERLAHQVAHAPHVARTGYKGANLEDRVSAGLPGQRLQRIPHLLRKQALGGQRGDVEGKTPGVAHHRAGQFLGNLERLGDFVLFLLLGRPCNEGRPAHERYQRKPSHDLESDCSTSRPIESQSNMVWYGLMDFAPSLIHESEVPLYRQLYQQFAAKIRSGALPRGERLPATRELAGLLGLNRTTVSAAYEMLETEGLIAGQVGRGSFVTGHSAAPAGGVDWNSLLERSEVPPLAHSGGAPSGSGGEVISFEMSRPSHALFPLDEFRASCAAVLARHDLAGILQLGSPAGFEPLRRYLI